jgi:hypothetical protein
MPRVYIELPEPTFQEAGRRALDQRRAVRDQIGYDLEHLYVPTVANRAETDRQPATGERAS